MGCKFELQGSVNADKLTVLFAGQGRSASPNATGLGQLLSEGDANSGVALNPEFQPLSPDMQIFKIVQQVPSTQQVLQDQRNRQQAQGSFLKPAPSNVRPRLQITKNYTWLLISKIRLVIATEQAHQTQESPQLQGHVQRPAPQTHAAQPPKPVLANHIRPPSESSAYAQLQNSAQPHDTRYG